MSAKVSSKAWSVVRQILVGAAFLVVVILLILWLMGTFHTKIPVSAGETVIGRPLGGATLTEVRLVRVPTVETAVGTIRAVHEASVASKLLAKVLEVKIKAGQKISRDELMVRLDDADLKARRQQAEAARNVVRAKRDQANTELERLEGLFKQNAAARIELDRAKTAQKEAEAELERADQAVREAETNLGYTVIRSPLDGLVVDKKVEVGDTVTPGQVLATLYDQTRMQLVARVRESLAQRLKVDQPIDVQLESMSKVCTGRISEIVPEAQTASRTFSVKVTGPCPSGLYSGTFGRLLIPLDEEEIVVVPAKSVRRIGQLDVVDVAEGQRLLRRAVQLGKVHGSDVQVLSGLKPGEKVTIDTAITTQRKGA